MVTKVTGLSVVDTDCSVFVVVMLQTKSFEQQLCDEMTEAA